MVGPSCTNDVNSNAWKPRKVAPSSAVMASQILDEASTPPHHPGPAQPGLSLFSTAASASTMASDDISSTNVETDVTGMFRIGRSVVAHCGGLHTSCGNGPETLRPLY